MKVCPTAARAAALLLVTAWALAPPLAAQQADPLAPCGPEAQTRYHQALTEEAAAEWGAIREVTVNASKKGGALARSEEDLETILEETSCWGDFSRRAQETSRKVFEAIRKGGGVLVNLPSVLAGAIESIIDEARDPDWESLACGALEIGERAVEAVILREMYEAAWGARRAERRVFGGINRQQRGVRRAVSGELYRRTGATLPWGSMRWNSRNLRRLLYEPDEAREPAGSP